MVNARTDWKEHTAEDFVAYNFRIQRVDYKILAKPLNQTLRQILFAFISFIQTAVIFLDCLRCLNACELNPVID